MSEPRILHNSAMMDLMELMKFSVGVGFSFYGKVNSSNRLVGGSIAKYSLMATKKSITPSSFSSAV